MVWRLSGIWLWLSLTPLCLAYRFPNLEPISTQLETLRGLNFRKEVVAQRQNRVDFSAYVTRQLATVYPVESYDRVAEGLARLGMMAPTRNLLGQVKLLMETQAAAYYDPETDSFFVLDSAGQNPDTLASYAAHELVHALQDQHFDLMALVAEVDRDYRNGFRDEDRIMALRALVEGEANYLMTLWELNRELGSSSAEVGSQGLAITQSMSQMNLPQMLQMVRDSARHSAKRAGLDKAQLDTIGRIPGYLVHPFYAAYLKGAWFVASLRVEHGWDAVSRAYEDPPRSSEQILHPRKYFGEPEERDLPTSMRFEAPKWLKRKGWQGIDEAIHGEFYLRMWLERLEVPAKSAIAAAAGWDGDYYRAWRRTNGEVLVALSTTWDDAHEATQFTTTLRDTLTTRYGAGLKEAAPKTQNGAWRLRYECGEGLGTGLIVRHKREVFMVEGADLQTVQRLMRYLTRQPIFHVR
ncbi:hypothetical protein SCOR_31025 [Sulfidibacter corallicola]